MPPRRPRLRPQLDLFAPPPVPDPEAPPARTCPSEPYWDYCPNCGEHLVNLGCKYRCPHCHYFMSCSDFD